MPGLQNRERHSDMHPGMGTVPASIGDHAETMVMSDDYEAEQNVAGFFLTLNAWINSSPTTH